MMKRFLLSVFLLLFVFSVAAAGSDGDFTLPDQLISIEAEAFMGLSSEEEIVIPDGTRYIGARAFADSSIKKVYLPASLGFIAADAFSGCDGLTAVVHCNSVGHAYCKSNAISHEVIHITGSDCVCIVCGDATHTPGEDCVCDICGGSVHAPGEDCICVICGATEHDMRQLESDAETPCYECIRCGLGEHSALVTQTELITGAYLDINEVTHTLADVEFSMVSCEACGKLVSETSVPLTAQTFRHIYSDYGDDYEQNANAACECGYVCLHENTYELLGGQGWDDDDIVSFDENSHTIQVTAEYNIRCHACLMMIGSRTCEELATSEHNFWDGDACSTCGYVRPACEHELYLADSYISTDEYTDITETTHTAIGAIYGSMACRYCDYWDHVTLEENASVVEKHEFSYDGICWKCEYFSSDAADEHVHSFDDGSCVCIDCGETVHEDSYWENIHAVCGRCGEINHEWYHSAHFTDITSCEPLNETQHVISGTAMYAVSCYECGLVQETDIYESCKELEQHTMVDGVCSGCGWAGCAHENVSGCVCSDCGSAVHTGGGICTVCGLHLHPDYMHGSDVLEIRNATYIQADEFGHIAVGELWAASYCSGCNGIVPGSEHIVAGDVRRTEEHNYVPIGNMLVCSDCGMDWQFTAEECSHSRLVTSRHEFMSEITECTPEYEIGIGGIAESTYCADCSLGFDWVIIEDNIPVQKRHVINGSGPCFNCGYMFDCVHTNISWDVGYLKDGMYLPDGENGHIFKGLGRMEGTCMDCGAAYYDGDYDGEGYYYYCEVPLPHNFDGCVCTDCGYSTHQPDEDCTCTVCGETDHVYSDGCACAVCSIELHDLTPLCICRDCGESFHEKDDDCYCGACGMMIHTPDADCNCTVCGAVAHTTDENCLCANCGLYAHVPGSGCICKKCFGEAHSVSDSCVCDICGAEAHKLDRDCICVICGGLFHDIVEFTDGWDTCYDCTRCEYREHWECGTEFCIRDVISCVPAGEAGHYSTGTPVMYTYCMLCRMEYGELVTGETRTLLEDHEFDPDGRCEACGYQSDDHVHSFNDGNCICTGCGETVHMYLVDSCDELDCPHFAHSACICARCGYANAHNYVQQIDYDSWTEEACNDFGHTVTVRPYITTTCSVCGLTDESVETVYLDEATRIEPHNYDDDATACHWCGYPKPVNCAHEETYSETFAYIYSESPTIAVTDTHRTGIGQIDERIYCKNCGLQISHECLERDVVVTEEHFYDRRSGRCEYCGYTPDCAHASLSEQLDTFMFDMAAAYLKDSESHTVAGTAYYCLFCDDCGVPYDQNGITGRYTEYTEPHFFIGGVCVDCGYAEGACAHEDAYDVYLYNDAGAGSGGGWVDVTEYDETYHTGLKTILVRSYCPDCDAIVRNRHESMQVTERHHLTNWGVGMWCQNCQVVFPYDDSFAGPNACSHDSGTIEDVTWNLWNETYSDITETGHTVTGTRSKSTSVYCTRCYDWLDSSEQTDTGETVTYRVSHSFWSEDGVTEKCACGYTRETVACSHGNTYTLFSPREDRSSVVSWDESGHVLLTCGVDCEICADCDEWLSEITERTERVWRPHNFDLNGVCSECEYCFVDSCGHENLVTNIISEEMNCTVVDELTHVVHRIDNEMVRCADCGLLISACPMRVEETVAHTVRDGFCTECSYIIDCIHENLGPERITEEVTCHMDTPERHYTSTYTTCTASCADCGLDVILYNSNKLVFGPHEFINGVCGCGMYEHPVN